MVLSDKALVGKVGGVIGNLEVDEMGNGPIVLANCLIGIESITLPIDSVYAHRVIGFSAGDKYNYFEQKYEMPETKIQGCYILSDLAAVDTSIQLTDTTTEGANLSAAELTTEWLSQHGFALGTTIDTPWSLSNTLGLWFEDGQIGTGIEDIWTDDTHTPQSMIRKMMINGQVLILRNGKLYNVMGNSL